MSRLTILDSRREPIKKKFEFLISEQDNDNERGGGNIVSIDITDEDKEKLAGLDDAWEVFKIGLEEASVVVKKSYASLKSEMNNTLDDYKKEVTEKRKEFLQHAPYSVDKVLDNQKAREKLQEFRQAAKELREKEEENKFGQELFDIDPVSYPELTTMERENQLLSEVWGIKEKWDGEWNKWKNIHFSELMIEDMDDKALEFQEIIKKFEVEVKKWGIFDNLKNKIDNFKNTLPLIEDLRHEAIRERHWLDLRREIRGGDFDEKSDDFTLEKVFELQLMNHASKIAELTDNAKKELKIEV